MADTEFTGKNVEEAVRSAAAALGIPESELEYEVLSKESKGFLGLLGSPARIRVKPKQQQPRPQKQEPRRQPAARPEPRRERAPRPGGEPRKPERREAPRPAAPTAEAPEALGAEDRERMLALLHSVFEAMKIDAAPHIKSDSDEELVVDIVGPDVAILIGKHGQTLDALQFLVGVAVNRGRKLGQRIILDAENYRERHAEMLRRMAMEYAKQVKERGEEAELEPQPARDRRVIHTALADDPDIYTYSEGTGHNRHVVISPRK